MTSRPTLHLTVGLPGAGKTTLARELERAGGALRRTPDEWMLPLFGAWSSEERWALRGIADLAGADVEVHYVTLPEAERIQRATTRWRAAPEETFEMTLDDHERFRTLFMPPTTDELHACSPPPPPSPFESWPAWASDRWPTLPRLDL